MGQLLPRTCTCVWEVGDRCPTCPHALFFLPPVFLALLIGASYHAVRGDYYGLSDFMMTTAITVMLVILGFVVSKNLVGHYVAGRVISSSVSGVWIRTFGDHVDFCVL
jgi:hypothetical protein